MSKLFRLIFSLTFFSISAAAETIILTYSGSVNQAADVIGLDCQLKVIWKDGALQGFIVTESNQQFPLKVEPTPVAPLNVLLKTDSVVPDQTLTVHFKVGADGALGDPSEYTYKRFTSAPKVSTCRNLKYLHSGPLKN